MKIINLFTQTYKLLKYNLILMEPLLLVFILVGFLLNPVSFSSGFSVALGILILAIGAIICVFISGWLNMIHVSIQNSARDIEKKDERVLSSLTLLREFFPGVGKYFPKIVIGMIIYLLFMIIVMNITGFLGLKFIGDPNFPINEMRSSVLSEAQKVEIINQMSDTNKAKLGLWYLLILGTTSIVSLLIMYWTQAVIVLNKNPLAAYWESIKTVFKKPFYSIVIFFSYLISLFLISIIGTLFTNFFYKLFILVLFFLTIVYFTIMTFLYFEQYRKNNNNSWTDSFR